MKIDAEAILSTIQDLERRVGTTAFEIPKLDLDDQGRELEIFDQELSLDAGLQASATIHAAKEALDDPFGVEQPATAPEGDSFVTVDLGGDLSLRGDGSASSKGVTFSAHGTAGAGFSYEHRRTVSQGRKRRTVLEEALTGVRLPQLLDLSTLDPGESHRLTAKVNLDLGLEVTAGESLHQELTATLFDGVSAQATVQAEATVQAALGLSLFDQMALTVGRSMAEDSWPRIRLQREKQRKLSLTATLDLTLTYDFGSALTQLLDNALDQIPTPALLDTFEEINDLLAAGDWDTVKQRITARGAAVLDDWLDSTGWREWLADSKEVQDFLELTNSIVDEFRGLDGRVRSLWEQLLGKVDLAPGSSIRKALEEVAAINPDDPDVLEKLAPGESLQRALALIERLSGRTLDELILDSVPAAKRALTEAVSLAQEALDFLDNTPQKILDRLTKFADDTGITRTIDFLAANATSTQAIESLVSSRIQRLVEVLVGKAWKAIGADDLAKVQSWAQRVKALLEKPAELEAKLKQELAKLNGQASFSASVAIDNEISRTALIDVEVDVVAAPNLADSLQTALEHGNAKGIAEALEILDEKLAEKDDKSKASGKKEAAPEALPFRLRESVFSSRRVRSRTFSLNFLGFNRKASVTRIEESRLQIQPVKGQTDTYQRLASFSASFSRREVVDAGSNETALWLESEAQGSGVDPAAPFDGAVAPTMRLVYSREDSKAMSGELDSMANLLVSLGFEEDGQIRRAVREGWTTQLIIQLHFIDPEDRPGATLRAVADASDKAAWNDAVLAAAKEWFANRIDDKSTPSGISYGEIFGQLIDTKVFLDNWAGGTLSLLNAVGDSAVVVQDGSRKEPIAWARASGAPNMQLGILYGSLLPKRRRGRAALAKTIERLDALEAQHDAEHYAALSRAFVNAGLRSAVYGPNWPSSLFILWLTLARLNRESSSLLNTARGLAVLRTRVDKGDPWQEPVRFRLGEGGIPRLI